MSRKIQFDIEEAKRLFEETGSWRAVARELGVHPYTIQYRLAPLGYETENHVSMRRGWDIRKAIRLRTEEGKTFKEIGEIMGVAMSTIQKGLGKKYKRRKK